jgi:hypothetical protein
MRPTEKVGLLGSIITQEGTGKLHYKIQLEIYFTFHNNPTSQDTSLRVGSLKRLSCKSGRDICTEYNYTFDKNKTTIQKGSIRHQYNNSG